MHAKCEQAPSEPACWGGGGGGSACTKKFRFLSRDIWERSEKVFFYPKQNRKGLFTQAIHNLKGTRNVALLGKRLRGKT